MGPSRARLDARRWHFWYGPIDLVLEACGEPAAEAEACDAAWRRFGPILGELVEELALLRRPLVGEVAASGAVARRMVAACRPYHATFITPMAAVAGAVADEVLAAMVTAGGLRKAYVNNGGDIALYLDDGERFRVGVVAEPVSAGVGHAHPPALDGAFEVTAAMPVRGVATSGWRGRSWSLGIADSVTVLAADAAAADAAATMIANAVTVDHPGVRRRPACELDENSDLGTLPVTVAVAQLPAPAVDAALAAGVARAESLASARQIWGAVLVLQRRVRVVGGLAPALRSH